MGVKEEATSAVSICMCKSLYSALHGDGLTGFSCHQGLD